MNVKLALLVAFGAGWLAGAVLGKKHEAEPHRVSVLTRRDTVVIERPTHVRIVRLPPDTVLVAVAGGTPDSCTAIVPRQQAAYIGDGYRAYVSGFRPALDSLVFERSVTTVTPASKQPRFTLGLQAGYGLTPRGLQPYIGLGLTCTIGF